MDHGEQLIWRRRVAVFPHVDPCSPFASDVRADLMDAHAYDLQMRATNEYVCLESRPGSRYYRGRERALSKSKTELSPFTAYAYRPTKLFATMALRHAISLRLGSATPRMCRAAYCAWMRTSAQAAWAMVA